MGLGDRYGLTREYSMEAIVVVSEVFSHELIGSLLSPQSNVSLAGRRHVLTTTRTLALLLLSPLVAMLLAAPIGQTRSPRHVVRGPRGG